MSSFDTPQQPNSSLFFLEADFEEKQAGIITVDPSDVKDMFYQDIPSSNTTLLAELSADLRPQSLGAFWGTTTYAAWRDIPTTYILCTKDRPTTVAAARYLIQTAKESGPHKIEKVIEVEAGHSPFISMPEWTAQTLIEESTRGA